eukprot:NODE_3683_length_919_cov_52.143939_g3531_i0.p1 GENE.NODE_3683_length_919_cov_52.143939_g3531_i0~~NODE_3683_length_919_cov_52.143939_g3531_i0.p1  ORF type:complete len:287 (-),score=83.71 NODE_3683_length_919_cov_52.143939_g3531_i0:59-871(-)
MFLRCLGRRLFASEASRATKLHVQNWERLITKRPDLLAGISAEHQFEFEKPKYDEFKQWKPEPIDHTTVAELLKWPEPDTYIFDLRWPHPSRKPLAGTIATQLDSIYLDFHASHEDWSEWCQRPKPDVHDDLIVVSYDGEDAEIAGIMLKQAGYHRVYNCRAGTQALLGETLVDNAVTEDPEVWAAAPVELKVAEEEVLKERLRKDLFLNVDGELCRAIVEGIWNSPDERTGYKQVRAYLDWYHQRAHEDEVAATASSADAPNDLEPDTV